MSGAADAFSTSYQQARERFLAAAGDAGLQVQHKLHPLKGRDGEELAMDIVREGPQDASSLLIVSSGCHGVEGFCGSGVQVAALRDAQWRAHAARRGVAVLYVHALNPYGFSFIRRTTHENVDLNRNFHDFTKPLPVNEGYPDLHPLLLPPQWPPAPDNARAIEHYVETHGAAAYQAAITRGQHEFPDGLFFGGTQPAWSNLSMREVLRKHASRALNVAWIDVHTGLGPSGVGERIYAGRDDAAAVARARAWWGGHGETPVTSIFDGSSSSAFLTGLMWTSVESECPNATYTGIALEYGTVPVMETLEALRAEHWLHLHPEAPPGLAASIKQQMKDAFYTDTPEWKDAVLRQARQALYQAADGLAA
ncbi:MAG: M14 family metallopeptidase [Ramlibacter sp.]|nr:M14 family metallopeptidase [Ramlibacter sp.]